MSVSGVLGMIAGVAVALHFAQAYTGPLEIPRTIGPYGTANFTTADLYPIAFGINGSPRIGRITRREIRSPIRADSSRDLERARIRLCEMQGDCHTCNHSKDTSNGHDAAPSGNSGC